MEAMQALKMIDGLLIQLKLSREEHAQVSNAVSIIQKALIPPPEAPKAE